MPSYRIISEPHPDSDHRTPRGLLLTGPGVAGPGVAGRIVTTHEAPTLASALDSPEACEAHRGRRIISAEEIHPGLVVTDEQIRRAMVEGMSFDPYEDDDSPLYGGGDFTDTVADVAEALRDSGLAPGLHLSLLTADGCVDYAMVEIYDEVRGIYLARGSELKRLTEDRSAAGLDGLVAIARALINISNDLH